MCLRVSCRGLAESPSRECTSPERNADEGKWFRLKLLMAVDFLLPSVRRIEFEFSGAVFA